MTEEEKAEVTEIVFGDTRVKEMLESKEYRLGTPFVMTLRTGEALQ